MNNQEKIVRNSHSSSLSTSKQSLLDDVNLCTLVQSISLQVQQRSLVLSNKLEILERKAQYIQKLSLDTNANMVRRKEKIPTKNQIEDEPSASSSEYCQQQPEHCSNNNMPGKRNQDEKNDKGDESNNIHGTFNREDDQLAEVETKAITLGISALKFFDDSTKFKENEDAFENHYFYNDSNKDDGESRCAPDDYFNIRPLPFIIGSKAFMEAEYDSGLNGDEKEEEDGESGS